MKSPYADGQAFFRKNADLSTCRLVLDGTGPGVSMHLPALSSIGMNRLTSFREVTGFSGGALAYVCFWAFENGLLRQKAIDLVSGFDKAFRKNHHGEALSVVRSIFRLIAKKPAFGEAKLRKHIRYLFSDEMLALPPSSLPENFSFYLAVNGVAEPVKVDHAWRLNMPLDMESILSAAVSIPFAYGKIQGEFYDVVYSKGYRLLYRELTSNESHETLVCSMWRDGLRGRTTFVKPISGMNAQRRLRSDVVRLLLNLPNRNYRREINAGLMKRGT